MVFNQYSCSNIASKTRVSLPAGRFETSQSRRGLLYPPGRPGSHRLALFKASYLYSLFFGEYPFFGVKLWCSETAFQWEHEVRLTPIQTHFLARVLSFQALAWQVTYFSSNKGRFLWSNDLVLNIFGCSFLFSWKKKNKDPGTFSDFYTGTPLR